MKELFTEISRFYPKENEAVEVVKLNAETRSYGLTLTEKEAAEIVEVHMNALEANGRTEVDNNAVFEIIRAFKDSPYIDRWSYKNVVKELIALFYEYKSETDDLVCDRELIEFMKEKFNGVCGGSTELLAYDALPYYAEEIRRTRGAGLFNSLVPTDD